MQITVNTPGAKTLRDSRPMTVDGQGVYVVVDGGTASLMIGGRIVAEKAAETMSIYEAQVWTVEHLTTVAEADEYEDEHDGYDAPWYEDEYEADEEAVAEATDPAAVYAAVVEQVRRQGDELNRMAAELEAHGEAPYVFVARSGRKVTFHISDPRHPARAAATHRRYAQRLTSWTWRDEQAYGGYVTDCVGDTDGYFAPLDRAAWKASRGA